MNHSRAKDPGVAPDADRRFMTALAGLLLTAPWAGALAVGSSPGTAVAKPAAARSPQAARRAFAKAATALTGAAIADTDTIDLFLDALKASLSAAQLRALLDAGSGSGRALLEWSHSAEYRELAELTMTLWLTGMVPARAGGRPTVVSYPGAAVWQMISSFTKPPGVCGGPVGYWAKAPVAPART